VELKTLRMVSNVPLRRVREAVVAAIVEKIPVVEGDVVGQKREISGVVRRWGELIDRIGGVNAVETVSVLQVGFSLLSSIYNLFKFASRSTAQHRVVCQSLARYWQPSTNLISSRKMTFANGIHSPIQRVRDASWALRLRTITSAG